jgi:hypothetical protein
MTTLETLKMRMEWFSQDTEKARLNAHTNQFINQKHRDLIKCFNDYVNELEFFESITDIKDTSADELLEVIKKQALIIASAKIEFPTINQSLPLLYDYYLSSIDNHQDIGIPHKTITVQIPVI